jgi:hypothetical protein
LTYGLFRRGSISREEAEDAIGLSCDSEEARGFTRELGPRIAQNPARAFAPASAQGDLLRAELISLVERMQRAPIRRPSTSSFIGAAKIRTSRHTKARSRARSQGSSCALQKTGRGA